MKKYKWMVIVGNLILLLVMFNLSIISKEKILKEGKLVLLKLAPVDPRSLMQGDYLSLRYEISENVFKKYDSNNAIPKRGYCVVRLDSNGVATKLRLQKGKTPVKVKEYLIEYTAGKCDLNIGASSYFFEEGQAEKYSKAKYGGLRIDNEGNSILIGLYYEKLKKFE